MGAAASKAAKGRADEAKAAIDDVVSNYLEFLESTSALIDEDIEDLGGEIAMITTQFRVSDELKAVSVAEAAGLQEDVEKYANQHKFAARRVFGILSSAYDSFEDLSYAITQPDDDDEDLHDDYDDEDDDEEDEEDDDEEEGELPDEDDEDDDDYNTQTAEDELAAELDDEDDEDDEEEEDEDAIDFEEFDDDLVTDEEVLYMARIQSKTFLEDFRKEMNDVGVPQHIITAREGLLRRLMFRAAENMVSDAVEFFVASYRNAALEDIDNLLCLGMTSGSLSCIAFWRQARAACEPMRPRAIAAQARVSASSFFLRNPPLLRMPSSMSTPDSPTIDP
jgi:hypothetical protein